MGSIIFLRNSYPFINNILNCKPLPVYGDGNYTRDWLYVKDHAKAIDLIFHKGKTMKLITLAFLIWKNIDLVKLLHSNGRKLGRENGSSEKLITYVKDRPGHDKDMLLMLQNQVMSLGGLLQLLLNRDLKTINWFLENKKWLKMLLQVYQDYYNKQYKGEGIVLAGGSGKKALSNYKKGYLNSCCQL